MPLISNNTVKAIVFNLVVLGFNPKVVAFSSIAINCDPRLGSRLGPLVTPKLLI